MSPSGTVQPPPSRSPLAPDLLALGLGHRDRLTAELGGGLPQRSIVLVTGEYGAGKSALAQRFTYGLCEESHQVTYLSTELSVSGFISQMHSLDYDVVNHLLDERLLFLFGETAPRYEGDRLNFLERLMTARDMWNADAIVIDAFDAILRNDESFDALVREGEQRQATLEIISFFRRLVSNRRVLVLTVDPTNLPDGALAPFRSIADVLLELETTTVGSSVRRQISVRRFAGMGQQVGDSIGFSVRPGVGIVVENRGVV